MFKGRKIQWLSVITLLLLVTGCSLSDPVQPELKANHSWQEITELAETTQVNMHIWGGSEAVNRYLDEWVKPRLKKTYNIDLNRVPIQDTQDILQKLRIEKQAGKKSGSVDMIWINGENFKLAKEQQLLSSPFVSRLPHYNQYYDQTAKDMIFDFGEPTEGLEAPWGKSQFVFFYDSAKVKKPPQTLAELKEWVTQNPGKFTYPAPPDFTGSAFIRQALYETTGSYEPFTAELDESALTRYTSPLWKSLNEMKPFLWRDGKTYPESIAKLDQLYANGEVWLTMGYDPAKAANQIQKGHFPKTTRSFVLKNGTLSNTHYLAIPFNASNEAGALVTINELLSPAAQMTKYDPNYWGEEMALDIQKLSSEDQKRLREIDRGPAVLPSEVLAKHRVPETSAKLVEQLEQGWKEHVAKQ
ncbi:ABC transporter substrate-binding protein [Hazenella sp. IB182357]|uniref:ABC transporter substrate-binding protein n=1 Tax=Polycladospora coralii TaxID=2771432 RepID=A0A926N6L1_9BACL|nr:ABC transporter substrate-binding protein [Polycladospora coralii]MBD1373174.1 ABC transporter substrate-binding protein [Polycladospora coralii]MBS7531731.1 ABC transporter substrate-binding protein [Polycladospora coralii]